MNPVILLSGGTSAAANGTPAWSLNQNYADNIRRVGGIPLLAVNNDCAEEYADLADGLLLSGGKDVAPALYGEELKYDFVITDPLRDDLEWKLIKAFVDRKKPIFGICRGVQVLNAYFGGTLYQDIPDELGGEHAKGVCHPVTLKKDSILGRLFGESLEINSYHHQAFKGPGKGSDGCGLVRCQRPFHRGSCGARKPSHLGCPVASGAYDRSGHQPGKLCGFPAHLPVLYGSVQKIRDKKTGADPSLLPLFYSSFLFRLFCDLRLLYFLLRYVLCHILGTILALCLWHCQVDLSACLVALIHKPLSVLCAHLHIQCELVPESTEGGIRGILQLCALKRQRYH